MMLLANAVEVDIAYQLAALRPIDPDIDEDDLKRRIDQAAKYVDLDQLCLSPQCGFASTLQGNLLTEDEQFAKLRLVVETAREVWS